MIVEATGSIFDSEAHALVNPVNCLGVMGDGLALAFKKKFPKNFKAYEKHCNSLLMITGSVFSFKEPEGPWIINFPTKDHYVHDSEILYIKTGLDALKKEIIALKLESIAIPALGCGLGGLEWGDVKLEIEKSLSDLENVKIEIFPPK